MSDVPRIGEGLDPFGHDEDDETAALLRGALTREADRVTPSPDGLHRIQREIRSQQAQRRRPRFARLAPALTAAAAVAVLAVAGTVAVRLNQLATTGGGAGPAGQPSASATITPEAPRGQVPVYVIGSQGGRKWLFREYRGPSSARTPGEKVGEAITDAVNLAPQNSDYDPPLFQGGPNSQATATVSPSLITVTLSAAMVSNPDVTREQAQLALEQLVWTATAAAGAGADTPVQFQVADGAQSLFAVIPLDKAYTRHSFPVSPTAPLWITSLVQRTDVGHKAFTVAGDAVTGDGGTVTWTLTRAGVQVGSGQATLDPGSSTGTSSRRGWRLTPPTQGRAGTYLLTVTLHPAPGTGLSTSATWQETRTFYVR